MIEVIENENFWHQKDWETVKREYFDPLIAKGEITNFHWEVVEDENYYRVRRTYWDMRERNLSQKYELPPDVRASYVVSLSMDNAAAGLDIIQNYKDYWPGMNLNLYGLAQSTDSDVNVYMELSNYEEDEEEDSDGDIRYDE